MKKTFFLAFFLLGGIIFANAQSTNAQSNNVINIGNTSQDNANIDLPSGVDLYYPENPEDYVDEEYFLQENNPLDKYADVKPMFGEQLPRSVFLNKDDRTATTTRITLYKNEGLSVFVKTWGSSGNGMIGTVFKDGEYYQSYNLYDNNEVRFNINPGLPHSSQWSLRLYCGDPVTKDLGCKAEGTISIRSLGSIWDYF